MGMNKNREKFLFLGKIALFTIIIGIETFVYLQGIIDRSGRQLCYLLF